MNILYDHQIFASQIYGGISRYFYEIIKRIAYKENVCLHEGYHINEYRLENIENLKYYQGVKRPAVRYTGWIFRYFNKYSLNKFANDLQIDIYHPTYYEDFNINEGKIIITVYDMIHELYYPNDVIIFKKKNLIEKADGIIAISESTKTDLINMLNIKPEKIRVIYLANSLVVDDTGDRLVKEPYVLYVGNRGGYKNFENYLKALALSRYKNDINIVCFGGGNFINDEKHLINDLKLENRIKLFSGDDKILANLYKYAEAFVYPSKYEGFGLPPLEAMQYGTPVIVSNTSSIPEVVGEAGIYFDPENIEEMAFKIDNVLENPELREKLSKKGIEQVKMFSWDKCANETIDFYKQVLDGVV